MNNPRFKAEGGLEIDLKEMQHPIIVESGDNAQVAQRKPSVDEILELGKYCLMILLQYNIA